MLETITKDTLFHEYYAQWITVYKEGAIRNVTLNVTIQSPKQTDLEIMKVKPEKQLSQL